METSTTTAAAAVADDAATGTSNNSGKANSWSSNHPDSRIKNHDENNHTATSTTTTHVIVVTGAGGYLGQCLIDTLIKNSFNSSNSSSSSSSSIGQQPQQQATTLAADVSGTVTNHTTTKTIIIMADIYFPTTFHFSSINDSISSSSSSNIKTTSSSTTNQKQDSNNNSDITERRSTTIQLVLFRGDISDVSYCESLFTEITRHCTSNSTGSGGDTGNSTSGGGTNNNNLNSSSPPLPPQSVSSKSCVMSLFHMGGVMSGDGERDFDLCRNVNLHGTMHLFEQTRKFAQQWYCNNNHQHTSDGSSSSGSNNASFQLSELPKVIFCSAGAIIGAGESTDYIQSSDTISDQCRATPHSTYGMTKACCELLLSDYTRRHFFDGRAIRLPTILVRAGVPNAATTSWFSSIVREPLAGRDLHQIPIDPHIRHAVTSTRAAIQSILSFYHIPKRHVDTICGYDRTIFIPAITVSLHELYTTLVQCVVHPSTRSLLGNITYSSSNTRDDPTRVTTPNTSQLVASFPTQINAYRAEQLFNIVNGKNSINNDSHRPSPPPTTIETMIREYIQDFPSAIVNGLQILPPPSTTMNGPSMSAPIVVSNTNDPITTATTSPHVTAASTTIATTTHATTPNATTVLFHDTKQSKIAIITGAGSGIGRAVAQRLVRDNSNNNDPKQQHWIVVLTGRTLSSLLETQDLCGNNSSGDTTTSIATNHHYETTSNDDKVATAANTTTRIKTTTASRPTITIRNSCICITTDVTIESDVIRLFEIVKQQFGRLDLLFNNAGINSTAASIEEVTLYDFERVMKTNVTGPFLCAREAVKLMSIPQGLFQGGGRIINNGSLSSQVPRPHNTAYTTSKHALLGLTKSIALDCRKYNVACGQVDFGNIVTELSLNTNKIGTGALQGNGTTTVMEPNMNVQDAAEMVYTMVNLPLEANILQMTAMATTMPFVGRG